MSIREQVAYLQGLAEGMNIDATDEGKLLSAIIDTLDDIADEIDGLNENALDIGDELDALSEDLADVEEFIENLDTDEDDDDFDFDRDIGPLHGSYDRFDDDFDDEDFGGEDFGDDKSGRCDKCGAPEAVFRLDATCPECNASLKLDENDIANEQVTCPACGKLIELQIDEVDIDDSGAG